MPSVLRGVDNDYTRSMGELQQRINSTGLGVYTGTTGDMLGFMERRTDAGPDSSFLASLAGGLGEAGYGAGYGAAPPSGVNSTPASGGGGASTPSSSNSSTPQTAQSFSLSQSDFNSLGLGGGSSQQPQQSSQASTPQGALSDWMSNMNSGYQQNIQQPQQGGYNQDGSFTNLAGNTFMMNSPENNPYGSMPRTGGPGPVPVPDWLKQQYQSTLGY
jgi:hypothetical protein